MNPQSTGDAKPLCRAERDGEILIVTLDRAAKLNALNQQMHRELEAIWNDFFADPGLRVGILTGAGDRAFSAGSDLAAIDSADPPHRLEHGYAGLTHRTGATKPIIAAVNGLALGGGFEVMLCCDLAVASSNAEFGLPEPLVGAVALGGGIPRLCRKLSFTKAMTLMLTSQRLSAAEALEWGLVSEVVPPGKALEAALRLARLVLRGAPLSIELTKAIADRMLAGDDLDSAIAFQDGEAGARILASDDIREGAAAFFERRAPVWRGS